MANLRRLLSKGYFPEELPQPFASSSFGRATSRTLPSEFLPNSKGKFKKAAFTAKHNLARVRQLRRILGLPNPVLFFNFCREMSENWTEIRSHIGKDKLTITAPKPVASGHRAIVAKIALPDRPQVRVKQRTKGRYALVTDIQQFYPSVYSHSLAWALHGKAYAKKNKHNQSLLGNRLDFWVRQGQDQQTRGIPIGPDTSLVLAEILLAAVDQDLITALGKFNGFRAIDDYELIFSKIADAENALANLQFVLDKYELRLNEEKTRIVELPQALNETWPTELRQFEIRTGTKSESTDLLDFFNIAFGLSIAHPKESILRYAISRVHNLPLKKSSWSMYQDLLLQCAYAEPGTLMHVTAELSRFRDMGYSIDSMRIETTIEHLIERHVLLGHGSEIAWAVWLAIATECCINKRAATLLPTAHDPLVPLLALHAKSKKLIRGGLDTTVWEELMTTEELWGDQWLLCYEANLKGWLPSKGKKDHVSADPCFVFLKDNRVTFYDSRASARKLKKWPRRTTLGLADYEL